MNRPVGWLLSSCFLILAGLYFFTPAPHPHLKQAYAEEGSASLADKQYYRAISFFERVLAYDPNQAEVRERIGLAYAQTIQKETAIEWLANLEKRNELSDEGKFTLATLYLGKDLPERAENLWIQVPSGSEYYLQAQRSLTDLYVTQARWPDSIRQLEKLYRFTGELRYHQEAVYHQIFQDPTQASKYMQANPGEYPPGLEVILSAFQAQNADQPSSQANVWLQIGDFFQTNNQSQLATRAYQRAHDVFPQSGIPLGKLANQENMAEDVRKQFTEQAIALEPDNPQVNELVGYAWLKSDKPEMALIYLIKANQLDPGNEQVLSALARTEQELGNLEQALQFLEQLANVNSGKSAGWMDVARFCLDHNYKLRERGLQAIRKAILADASQPEVLDLAGQIYWDLGDLLTAKQYFQKALDQDSEYLPAQLHYALCLINEGESKTARTLIELVIEKTTDSALRQQAIKAHAELGN